MDSPQPVFSSEPPPSPPNWGVSRSTLKVIWSAFLGFFLAVVLLGCGGIMNPRWLGWCLLAAGVIAALFAIAELWSLLDRSPVLAFYAEGLFDRSEKPAALIPWHEIHGVSLWTLRVNGLASTRKLILKLGHAGEDAPTRSIELTNLKGNPTQIAEAVLAWVNGARQSSGTSPLPLGQGDGSGP